ncbi:MAG: hypothetical protein H6679_03850 [Epsilonproteobacteria bacterium]|nr:hypothetical protein [Campylobacterota bacterium]
MKKTALYLSSLMMCFLLGLMALHAVSLDGTVGIVYKAASHPFGAGEFATGFVKLDGGFSLPGAGTVTFNVFPPVAGPVDLGGGGTLLLAGDMHLASSATLPDSGMIDGAGNTIFLDGDLSVPAGKTITIISDTTIDGQGHVLNLSGDIVVAGGASTVLTLRNVIITGLSGTNLSVAAGGSSRTLVLQEAVIHLSGDFVFSEGSLEILDFVRIMEPFSFVFNSDLDLLIEEDSTLFIDIDTDLFYIPADSLSTHFVMAGPSSQLFLNGAFLTVPRSVGLRLTDGHLIIDHKTTFLSDGPTQESQGIILGDGSTAGTLQVTIMPGASIEVEDGFLSYKNPS